MINTAPTTLGEIPYKQETEQKKTTLSIPNYTALVISRNDKNKHYKRYKTIGAPKK
jgi:hypothetical protein